jgi:hypothetical protein
MQSVSTVQWHHFASSIPIAPARIVTSTWVTTPPVRQLCREDPPVILAQGPSRIAASRAARGCSQPNRALLGFRLVLVVVARDGTIGVVNRYVHVFAVMRHDLYVSTSDIRNAVTIVAVVPTAEEARAEVDRLSDVNAGKRCEYFWQSARYYPEGRGARPDEQ